MIIAERLGRQLATVAALVAIMASMSACSSSGDDGPSTRPAAPTCNAACESSSEASQERAQVAALRDDCMPAAADDVIAIKSGLVGKGVTVSNVTSLKLTLPVSNYTRVVAAKIAAGSKPVAVWALGSPYIDSLNETALRYSNYGRATQSGSQAELERIALQATGEFTAVAQCVQGK